MDAVISGTSSLGEGITGDPALGPHLTLTNPTPPSNDDFLNAETIVLDLAVNGRMIGSGIEVDEFTGPAFVPYTALYQGAYPYSVWYTYTPTVDFTLAISAGPTDAAITIALYSYTGPTMNQGNLALLTSAGPDSVYGPPLYLEYPLTNGVQYFIQVLQAGEDTGIGVGDHISTIGDGEVTFVPSRALMQLGAEIYGSSSMAVISAQDLAAQAGGSATMTVGGTFLTGLSANVAGESSVRFSVLEIDTNPRIEVYEFDPGAGAAGSVTADPGIVYPNTYLNETGVALIECVGASMDPKVISEYVAILSQDAHSSDTFLGFLDAPIKKVVSSSTVYSYERWVRVRFQYPFNTVDGLRFWTPTDLSWLGAGWTVKVGYTDTYATPVNAASSIATLTLPTTDPGIPGRNLMGSSRGIGTTDDFYSKWLVIQASVDLTVATTGNAFGFTPEGLVPVPLDLQFAWVET